MDVGVRDSATRTTRSRPDTLRTRGASQNNMNFSIQAVNPKSTGSDAKIRCHLCDKEHKLENCEEFKKKDGDEQFKIVRSKKLCDNCLSSYHFSAGCKRWKACKVPDCNVKRKHLTSLHEAIVAYEKKRNEQSGSSSD